MRSYVLIDTTGTILPGDLASMVAAANWLVAKLCDAWDLAPITGSAISKSTWDAYTSETDPAKKNALIPSVDIQFRFVSSDPNVPGALGYHDEVNATPYAELLIDPILQNGGGVLDAGTSNVSLASVFFHELAETACDEFVSSWILMPSGSFIALESADPVEGALVPVVIKGTIVYLSNFVFPRYFDAQAPTDGSVQFDFGKTCTAPFQLLQGGYQILFDPTQVNSANGPVSNVFGELMPEWKRELKATKARNLMRKGIKLPEAVLVRDEVESEIEIKSSKTKTPETEKTEDESSKIKIPPPPETRPSLHDVARSFMTDGEADDADKSPESEPPPGE